MHLENFENVADALATRDLIIKDLTLRLSNLEEARKRHIDLLEQHAKLYDSLQARTATLESRLQFALYPVPQFPPIWEPCSPPWYPGLTCSGVSATQPATETTGFSRPPGWQY